jgi:hypothetical protein
MALAAALEPRLPAVDRQCGNNASVNSAAQCCHNRSVRIADIDRVVTILKEHKLTK